MIKLFVTGILLLLVSFFLGMKDLVPQYPFIPFLTGAIGFILMLAAAFRTAPRQTSPRRK